MRKVSKFCSESFHCDTNRRWNRALLTWQKNSTGSPAVATVRIAPNICQGQPPTMYSECSIFYPNRFTFGGVIAERVNIAKTRRTVNPIFGWSLASIRIIIYWFNADTRYVNILPIFVVCLLTHKTTSRNFYCCNNSAYFCARCANKCALCTWLLARTVIECVDEPAQHSTFAASASASSRSRTISRSTSERTQTNDLSSARHAPKLFVARIICVITSTYRPDPWSYPALIKFAFDKNHSFMEGQAWFDLCVCNVMNFRVFVK